MDDKPWCSDLAEAMVDDWLVGVRMDGLSRHDTDALRAAIDAALRYILADEACCRELQRALEEPSDG